MQSTGLRRAAMGVVAMVAGAVACREKLPPTYQVDIRVDEAGIFEVGLSRPGIALRNKEFAISLTMADVGVFEEDGTMSGRACLNANGGVASLILDVKPGSRFIVLSRANQPMAISIDGVAKAVDKQTPDYFRHTLSSGQEKIVIDFGDVVLKNWRYCQNGIPEMPQTPVNQDGPRLSHPPK